MTKKGKNKLLKNSYLSILAIAFFIVFIFAFIKNIFFNSDDNKLKYNEQIKTENSLSYHDGQKNNEKMPIPQINLNSNFDEDNKIKLPNLPKQKDEK